MNLPVKNLNIHFHRWTRPPRMLSKVQFIRCRLQAGGGKGGRRVSGTRPAVHCMCICCSQQTMNSAGLRDQKRPASVPVSLSSGFFSIFFCSLFSLGENQLLKFDEIKVEQCHLVVESNTQRARQSIKWLRYRKICTLNIDYIASLMT